MSLNLVTTVWATVSRVGFHCWPDAPEHRAYLRHDHRHLFVLRAEVGVTHDDRQVEVHDLADEMAAWWRLRWTPARYGHGRSDASACGTTSCEQMAAQLAQHLHEAGNQVVRVDVAEDGECGAGVAATR